MTVQVEVGVGGIPHNKIMIYGLVGSLILVYLTYLNEITGTE